MRTVYLQIKVHSRMSFCRRRVLPSNIRAAATAELTTYAGECEHVIMSKNHDAGHWLLGKCIHIILISESSMHHSLGREHDPVVTIAGDVYFKRSLTITSQCGGSSRQHRLHLRRALPRCEGADYTWKDAPNGRGRLS